MGPTVPTCGEIASAPAPAGNGGWPGARRRRVIHCVRSSGALRTSLQRRLGADPLGHTIARRVAIDLGRRARRRPATTTLEASVTAPGGPTHDQTWEAWQVRCALRDLPGDERELIRLTHYVGLTQSQIAERLGLPLGTVKSRSHRVHRHLAEQLAHLRQLR